MLVVSLIFSLMLQKSMLTRVVAVVVSLLMISVDCDDDDDVR